MTDKQIPHWETIHTLVFDFDGVFTNNKVWVDQNGIESVCCDRGDGLAFDLLRQFVRQNNWSLRYFILSKETNPVVSVRARKIQIECIQSTTDKAAYLVNYLGVNKLSPEGLIYLGNDLNDLAAMKVAGFTVAPCDAHPLILRQADIVMTQAGGEGFVRAFIEALICLEDLDI